MKFLHVIPPRQNIIYPFVKMISDNFNKDEHYFQVSHRNKDYAPQLAECENVEFFEQGNILHFSRIFLKKLKEADCIIWHSLYLKPYHIVMLNIFSSLLKKSAWVEWGKDLYNWKSTRKSIFTPIYNILKKRLISKIACYVAIFPPDMQVFYDKFKTNAPVLYASYLSVNTREVIESTRPDEYDDKHDCVNIQVAHSCNVWNNHAKILDDLTRYRYEDILLHIPLSTGLPIRNRFSIQHYADKLYGEKAISIIDEMEKEDYVRHLWGMDIAVFRLYRQAGLGNILRLLYMGKKVYLPKDTVMYDFLTSEGVEVFDSTQIAEMSYEEFIEPPNECTSEYILDLMDPQKMMARWQNVFDVTSKLATKGEGKK